MISDINVVALYKRVHRSGYKTELPEDFGISGLYVELIPNIGRIIVTTCPEEDKVEWIHASISFNSRLPTYSDIVMLKEGVFGDDRECYQIFPEKKDHINIHHNALHLWGRVDGKRVLPNFARYGTI